MKRLLFALFALAIPSLASAQPAGGACDRACLVGFIDQYGFPEGWCTDAFVRGTLRPQGWRAAWKSVFDTVAAGDHVRLAALADELAERYPTTDTDRDRVVLTVAAGVGRLLAAAWPPGLHRAAVDTDEASHWLDRLARAGLPCTHTSPPAPDPAKAP